MDCDDFFQDEKLPVGMLTRDMLDRRRAAPELSCAYERYIPISCIQNSVKPLCPEYVSGKFDLGQEILCPIEVRYDEKKDVYFLINGKKRLTQARLNRQTHIHVFIEPDRRALIEGRRAIGALASRVRPDGASHFCYMNGAGDTRDFDAYDVFLHCHDHKRLLARYGTAQLAWELLSRHYEGSPKLTVEDAQTGVILGLREGDTTLIAFEYSLMKYRKHPAALRRAA